MKKIGLSLLLVLGISIFSRGQLRIALAGGGHQSTVIETNNQPNWNDIKDNYKGRTGIHLGFVADLQFGMNSNFYFQPGVLYYNKGRKFDQQFDPASSTIISQKSTQYINYIDVPLNIVRKFGKKTKFLIGAGPYASFFFNGEETSQTITQTGVSQSDENNDLPVGKKPGQYEVLNFGVNGLIGVEFGRVFLTANYSRGLNDFYTAKDYEGTFKHQVIGFTLGVFLGKPVAIEKVKDKDRDGIPDDRDSCKTEAGPAITNGCPDADSDGIADTKDECPTEPGTLATKGCPDKDGDAVADKDDKCPDVKGPQSNNGCPVADKDSDGVTDDIDRCPDVAGVSRYNGCPVPDTDKDGINDENDKCPTQAGLTKYNGCPIPDTDSDGINDEEDKCPAEKGLKENNGCPEIKKDIIDKVNFAAQRIQFEHAKADLLPESIKVLDDIVKILKENTSINVLIEGHTSNDGIYAANMILSENRANRVKSYFESKGIEASRLTTKGYGPNQPLNTGKSAAAKSQNRRVELKLSN